MRKQHAAEIEALNKKVAELARARPVAAPLEQRPVEADDLEALRAAAEAEAEKEAPAEKPAEETIFKSGNLGLQALNPELSITGDLLGTYRVGEDVTDGWDWNFRNLGLHFESYLDPYSRMKAAVEFSPEGAELGEAYFTRFGVLENLNVTLGKFRQQFGVVNRWHKHALDWFDFPLPLRYVFGEGGLNQTGASLDWSGPLGPLDQELIVQVTDGENPRIFGQNSKHRPSVLAHYRLYQDLSPSTYLELGATGLFGWNDSWPIEYWPQDRRGAGHAGVRSRLHPRVGADRPDALQESRVAQRVLHRRQEDPGARRLGHRHAQSLGRLQLPPGQGLANGRPRRAPRLLPARGQELRDLDRCRDNDSRSPRSP